MAVKFFLQIWLFNRRHRSHAAGSEAWEKLLQKQAAEYKRKALQLKGLTIKVGQFLSTRADLMPDAFTRELKDLMDRVPPVTWLEARQVMEEEWNVPYDSVFSEISEAPVASASIADVYRARLNTGEEVAVKIQRPEMERIIEADFRAIRVVIKLAKRFTKWGKVLDLDRLYKELVETITKELDFRKEREHAARFAGLFKDQFQLYIPRYFDEWVTRRVLVMEWIDGVPVTDVRFMEEHGISRAEVVRRIVGCSLHQIIQAGFFHADPHPGNILLKQDGTIVYLDFGMMGSINSQAKHSIRYLIRAVVEQNYEKMVDALDELKFIRKGVDRQRLAGALQMGLEFYLHRSYLNLDDEMLEKMMGEIRDFVQTQPIQMPAEYAFLGRAFSILTGVVTSIDPEVDYLEVGKPYVQQFLQDQDEENEASPALSWVKETGKDLLMELIRVPHQVNTFFDNEKRKVHFEIEHKKTARLQRYYEERKRMLILLAFLTGASGTTFYVFNSHTIGISAYVVTLFFLMYYKVLDRRLFRRIQSLTVIQKGDDYDE